MLMGSACIWQQSISALAALARGYIFMSLLSGIDQTFTLLGEFIHPFLYSKIDLQDRQDYQEADT